MKSAIVIGGLNLDICGMPDGELVARDSNIGTVAMRAGGVGHNIAARLAELGVPVELAAVLGDDGAAHMLSARCAEEKIGLRYALRLHGASCCYLSLHERDGDMAAAVNAMKLMESFTPERLPMEAINAAALCVADANLPAATLEALAARASTPILADPVSCAKADRVRDRARACRKAATGAGREARVYFNGPRGRILRRRRRGRNAPGAQADDS